MTLRVVFAGTPAFAVPSLRAVAATAHRIECVYTQPDRPAGRGRRLTPPPVREEAGRLGIPVRQPRRLDPAEQAFLAELAPDLMIVVAYGLLLPPSVLGIPRLGCVNIHASLLPRWRGAAPVARAIEAGDTETGVTLMQMDAGMDTGAILAAAVEPIHPQDTAGMLQDRLASLGAALLASALPDLAAGNLTPAAQDDTRSTRAPKLAVAESWLDWSEPAVALERRVRAFLPWPVGRGRIAGETLRLWAAEVLRSDGSAGRPGEVVGASGQGLDVACGEGVLRVLRVQRAGGRPLPAAEFLRGCVLAPGTRFEQPPEPGGTA